MKKIRIKDLVEFGRKTSENTRKTFIRNLKDSVEKQDDADARNYWVRSEATIKRAFRDDDTQCISDKIDELQDLLSDTSLHGGTIKQYNHNISILKRFEDFNFSTLRPSNDIKILSQRNGNKIIPIFGLPIESAPSYVYSFENSGKKEIGAIWFVAKKNGFKDFELGMFVDILHRYLKIIFLGKCEVNSKFCIAVDLFNRTHLNYYQLEHKEVAKMLNPIVSKMKELIL
ncbi:MAG: hypothetical protein LBV18_01810 [Alistipes sp.]|jgi:hypothetical protein|nr:hypothetical protein [Alistipes sp.]